MRQTRRILLFVVLLVAIIAISLWWARPRAVDMATYAPADSLLYLEANRPLEVVDAILGTEAWKGLEKIAGHSRDTLQTRWLRRFFSLTGIGSVRSVILARAQMAAVVTDLRAVEEGDTLNIRPEGALLIETHTAERRIKASVEEFLKTLAERTYGKPTLRRITVDGVEYIEWIAPENSRQIVGVVVGSLAIIGTSEHVVQACVAVTQGRRPSLKADPELHQMRARLAGERALTFGYVPPTNSAKLLAVGLPLLLGRAPGDSEFQRLITSGATKIFGSLGWTSGTYLTGIEDRYLITVQPAVVTRLKPTFGATEINSQVERLAPNDTYSVTAYKFANHVAVWQSLKSTVSSQVDALSTIVFSSLLKSAMLSYGIDDPETFLGAVHGEVLTIRFDENAGRSILIAHVRDGPTLRHLVTKTMKVNSQTVAPDRTEIFEDSEKEIAVSLTDELVVMGSRADVRSYAESRAAGTNTVSPENLKRMTYFASSSLSINVVTYTNDSDRVRNFMFAIIATKGVPRVTTQRVEEEVVKLPFSVTETMLGDSGIERITRSPLGQFSTLLPLLFPEKSDSLNDGNQSR